ncbi:helix-turn-helix transcriptional regulator [Parasphingorhabdus sp.]|uniref:helix-turn-helix transcriptional regulator n=1 Tax=Parasphingorhabdus sp. TaxID=2709688 RepID=UPI003A95277F
MTMSNVDRLSDGQRDCLRLVLAHHNSKEIARQLGVSPHTVDQRLRTSMRILNVQSRFEAARKFAGLDNKVQYQPLIYQMLDVESESKNGKLDSSTGRTVSDETGSVTDISKVAKVDGNVAVVASEKSEIRHPQLPIPRHRGERNNLGTVERLGWILAIAIVSALSFGGLIAGLEALSRLKG